MESKDLLREEEATRIAKELKEKYNLEKFQEILKDNKYDFSFEDKEYRVRLLNMAEKEELDALRRKKFGQLIQDKDILLEKDLIQIYKSRNIDLEEMQNKIKKLSAEKMSNSLKQGEAISKKAGESILKNYTEKIETLSLQINILSVQIRNLLNYSLENQLANYVIKCLTYLALEIKKEDKYVKAFHSIEDFEKNASEKLVEQAIYYTMLLN